MTIPFSLLVGGRIPYFLLYTYLLTLAIPCLHGLLGKIYIKGAIIIPEKDLVPGEEIKINYSLYNPLRITFARIEVENSIAQKLAGGIEEMKVFSLEADEEVRQDTIVVCRRRGIYELGEIRVYIRDIFNMYTFKKIIKTPIALKVYPVVVPLSSISVDSSEDFHSLSELRDYREGDPIRKIHWRASAKKDALMVKNYDEEANREVVILLDNYMDSYKKDLEHWIEDKAIEVTLSIAQHFLLKNIKVTLFYQQHNKTVEIKGTNHGYLKLFMEQMVSLQPNGKDPYSFNIGEVSSRINQGCTLFLVTPRLNRDLGAQGIRLKMKNLNPRYIVVGDEEIDPKTWNDNKKIVKVLNQEGIATYVIDRKHDVRRVLEVKYETY